MKTFLVLLLISFSAFAGRPLFTDDAGVLGKKTEQLETWVFVDKRSFQHWIVPTLGIGEVAEVSISGVQGFSFLENEKKHYSYGGPIVQGKIKLRDTKRGFLPGIAIAGGNIPPYGEGFFAAKNHDYFYYLASTWDILADERLFFHLNVGRQSQKQIESNASVLLWGAASEVKTIEHQYVFIEMSNGEVYAIIPGIAAQSGFRHEIRPGLQFDGSVGTGLTGEPVLPFWMTLGFRFVGNYF